MSMEQYGFFDSKEECANEEISFLIKAQNKIKRNNKKRKDIHKEHVECE